ncbi:hypothetical protein [Iodidimonas gelatinilytica]|nr:hypothetical protein [Iodidimonas gelatinilytica]
MDTIARRLYSYRPYLLSLIHPDGIGAKAKMTRHALPLLLAACILSFIPATGRAGDCTIHTLSECRNTNRLMWDPAFREAREAFIGDRPAGWLYENGTMLGQVNTVLGGPPDEPVYFSDNLVRFSACRPHSCDEKGAVVLTTDGEIVAVGVLHFDNSRTRSGHPMLTILTRKRDDRFQEAADHLIAWYEMVTTDYNNWQKESYGLSDTSDELRKTSDPEIVLLAGTPDSQP